MNLWVAEYSQSQDAVHVQLLDESIRENFRRAIAKEEQDYVVIGVFSSHDEASERGNELRRKQNS